ncbi:MAG: L-threonylcarbamoyladenylate synthase [Actinomycetaceae bacterium]|nr:L-threonylcarbamoyladenylate synthase [Actinomycetaceae bacterium]
MNIVQCSTKLNDLDADQIKRIIASDGVIVLPTDTVYGIGANPYSTAAVNAVLRAKGRGRQMPPPVLIPTPEDAENVSEDLNDCARALIQNLWPGALTLITKAPETLRFDLGDIKDTIAIRMPDHPVTLDVLSHTGPLAVTSANLTGKPPATNIEQAIKYFDEDVACYIDSGPTPGPVPSTIIDVTGEHPVLLRAGAIDVAVIEEICGEEIRGRGE